MIASVYVDISGVDMVVCLCVDIWYYVCSVPWYFLNSLNLIEVWLLLSDKECFYGPL